MSKRAFLVTLIIFALLFVGVMMFWPSPPPPRKPLPSPNGYDELVKAAALIRADASGYRTNLPEELRWTVAANAEALESARAALLRESRVPDDFTSDYLDRRHPELSALRRLAHAFAAESRLAELDGHPSDAFRNALDATRLGANSLRGGVLIFRLIGLACENVGLDEARRHLATLGTNDCRLGLDSLLSLDAKREPFENTIEAEREWVRLTATMPQRLASVITTRSFDPSRKMMDSSRVKVFAGQRRMRELILAVAARLHELEHGKRPASIADLVPRYLPSAPVDPETGSPLALP